METDRTTEEMKMMAKLDSLFPTEDAIYDEWSNHWPKLLALMTEARNTPLPPTPSDDEVKSMIDKDAKPSHRSAFRLGFIYCKKQILQERLRKAE